MAVGGPLSWSLRVDWTGTGTLVDESARLKADVPVQVTRGRGSSADDVQPATISITLDNSDGRFTPGNQLSPLFPNVRDGVRADFQVTRLSGGSPVSVPVWRGTLSVGAPDLPGGELSRATMTFEGVDILGDMMRRVLRSDHAERWAVEDVDGNIADYYGFDPSPLPTSLARWTTGSGGTGKVVPARSGAGRSRAEEISELNLDGQLVLEPVGEYGPCARFDWNGGTALPVREVSFAVSCSTRASATKPNPVLAEAYGPTGERTWSLRLFADSADATITKLGIYDRDDVGVGGLTTWHESGETNEAWRIITLTSVSSGVIRIQIFNPVSNTFQQFTPAASIFLTGTKTLVLGGRMTPRSPGGQFRCVNAKFAGVVMSSLPAGDAFGWGVLAGPFWAYNDDLRQQQFAAYGRHSVSILSPATRSLWTKSTRGRTLFDVASEAARSCGALLDSSSTADAAVLYRQSESLRPANPAMTVDAEGDLDGTAGLPWRMEPRPTVVTASWSGGEVTEFAPDRDPARPDLTRSIETTLSSARDALSAARWELAASGGLRLTQLTVDLATASNDLWVAWAALRVGDRVRVNIGAAGSPLVRNVGRTFVDVHVAGWTLTFAEGVALVEIDTIAADDPVEGRYDTERGRFGSEPGALLLAAPITESATSISVVVTAPALTTSPSAFPLTINVGGEWMTVPTAPSAPSAGVQVVTVSARGVAPTVARAHAASETIDIALPAASTW
jgi:hypothetical protein